MEILVSPLSPGLDDKGKLLPAAVKESEVQ